MLSLSMRQLSVPAHDAGGVCLLPKLVRSGERGGALPGLVQVKPHNPLNL